MTIAVPDRVNIEVRGRSNSGRFKGSGAHKRWVNLSSSSRIQILSDELTDPTFTATVTRIGGAPATERVRDVSDLGELMVIAHASRSVQRGEDAFIVIDEGEGRRKAAGESAFLVRRGSQAALTLWSTPRILRSAAAEGMFADRWEVVYNSMRKYDDGLPALSNSYLPDW